MKYLVLQNFTAALLLSILLFAPSAELLAQEGRPTEALQPLGAEAPGMSKEASEERLNDAKILFDRGKTDAAIFMLQQLEKADPSNYKVLFKLGEMAIADRNWAYSISVLRKASLIRPRDIEVRLILIDIYKAYQMPIQSIVIAKEILALAPNHIIGTQRLAFLYKEQAMLEDEILIRIKLQNLLPKNYDNLKRLASIYDESGDLWESARIYKEIETSHPEKKQDMTRLAGLYGRLGESFRALGTVQKIEKQGYERTWLKNKSIKSLRKQTNLSDDFSATLLFRGNKSEELRSSEMQAKASYIRRPLLSSLSYGLKLKLQDIQYEGLGILDGETQIESARLLFSGQKNWQGESYVLHLSAGVLSDQVSGRLFTRDPNAGATVNDFPFLKDPSFKSYGGELPIGKLNFSAKPGLHATYGLQYQRDIMSNLEARLEGLHFDKVTLRYHYQTDNLTEISVSLDESLLSDGNQRFHQSLSSRVMLWGSEPVYDYTGARQGFFQNPPFHFVALSYRFDYFNDDRNSTRYQAYRDEIRNKGILTGQFRVFRLAPGEHVFAQFAYAYTEGSILDYEHVGSAKLAFSDPDGGRALNLALSYLKSQVTDSAQANQRLVGKSEAFTLTLNLKIQF